jgi:hypothetical protein
MKKLLWMFAVCLAAFGCSENQASSKSSDGDDTSSQGEEETDSSKHQDTDTQTEPRDTFSDDDSESSGAKETDPTGAGEDSDSSSDSDVPLGSLGDPCWIPVLPKNHPNEGLRDCEANLSCVGDNDEAWCTTVCTKTGSTSTLPDIEGWCCGEVGSVCDATQYFMPETMSSNCAPRVLALGESCESAGDLRCAPVCDGTKIVRTAVCTQTADAGFCSYPCEDDGDCKEASAFENGCCGSAMGGSYCMPETSDLCL